MLYVGEGYNKGLYRNYTLPFVMEDNSEDSSVDSSEDSSDENDSI